MQTSNVTIALLLSLFAGLSTLIGGLVVFSKKTKTDWFLGWSMAFAAGVMIYVSFIEMIPHSFESLGEHFSDRWGNFMTVLLLFSGMALIALIDKIVLAPKTPNINEPDKKKKLFRTGLLVSIAIAIHNFPEGIATFASALNDVEVGIMITIAIAIHNIPEGIAVATPIYKATGSKRKALGMTFLSGIAEPLGAIIAFLIIGDQISDLFFGYIMSFIAGIMIFISFDFLLPTALDYCSRKKMVLGLITGMFVMAVSLLIE